MDTAAAPCPRLEDLFHVRQTISFEAAANDRRCPVARFVRFRKTEVEKPVGFKVGMRQDLQEPALPPDADLGDTLDRIRQQDSVANDPQASGAFGDQHVAVRQECDRPGVIEPFGNSDTSVLQVLGAEDLPLCLDRRCQSKDQQASERTNG